MKVDVIGRVKRVRFSPDNFLQPLYEAVSNSFDAIADRGIKDGRIVVEVHRKKDLASQDPGTKGLVDAFSVTDNGIGFTTENYESFDCSDSMMKYGRGGKGIGRFVWLKAFEIVSVVSVYEEDASRYFRSFDFKLVSEGIVNQKAPQPATEQDISTTVRLKGFKPDLRTRCPIDLESIAQRVLEHCLIFFLDEKCATVTIFDTDHSICLNDLCRSHIEEEKQDSFSLGENDFLIRYLRLVDSITKEHRIHYCANRREVKNEAIKKLVPDLTRKLADGAKSYYLGAYLSGVYLDKNVNDERTDFAFASDMLPGSLDKDAFQHAVTRQLKSHLQEQLKPIVEEKHDRIKEYVRTKNPALRYAAAHAGERLDDIPPGATDETIDHALSKIDFQLAQDAKAQLRAFIEGGDPDLQNLEKYERRFKELIDKVDEIGKSKLADYVLHRKTVLDLLQSGLKRKDDGKYHYENYIHRLVCPLRTTSDDVPIESLNLWLIDEKLSYHRYLASATQIRKMGVGEYEGQREPDIAIFDRPHFFSEDEPPFDTVVIIEFKRPGRDDYRDGPEHNPIDQVMAYIRQFMEEKIETSDGRPIERRDDRRFYCYIIADLMPTLRTLADARGYKRTPDDRGRWWFHSSTEQPCSAYVEIIPYERLLQDATKRNRILFDKLNLQ